MAGVDRTTTRHLRKHPYFRAKLRYLGWTVRGRGVRAGRTLRLSPWGNPAGHWRYPEPTTIRVTLILDRHLIVTLPVPDRVVREVGQGPAVIVRLARKMLHE